MKKVVYLINVICLIHFSVNGAIRYVKPSSSGLSDGSSWANASSDLQAMINASSVGDEVWVAAGVYYPLADGSGNSSPSDARNKLFFMKSGVKLYGGFSGTETVLSQRSFNQNQTIISGDIDQNDTNTDGNYINESYNDIQGSNSFTVMAFAGTDESTIFDGFIVTGGKNTSTSGYSNQYVNGYSLSSYRGGALYCSGASPIIRNCIISGNQGHSGVLYQNNQGISGGWTTKLENTYWIGNNASDRGLVYFHRGNVLITNTVFASNNAYYAGIFVSSNMPNSNTIYLDHVTYAQNSIYQYGNHFQFQGGTVLLKNSIIWENSVETNPLINNDANSLTITYSNIQGAYSNDVWNSNYGIDGGNNIDLDPLFSDSSNPFGSDAILMTTDDGLSLGSCSPVVNVANTGLSSDITGYARPNESENDMGAYEFQGASTLPDDAVNLASSSYQITCGETVTLTGTCSQGTLTWYDQSNGGTALGTGTEFDTTPLENPTVYYASCETSSTCKSFIRTATSEIIVSLPDAPTNLSTTENDICPGSQVTLTAICQSPTSVEWFNGSTSIGSGNEVEVSPNLTTTYSAKCKTGVCYSDNSTILIRVISSPTYANNSQDVICAGESITYTSSCEAGSLVWKTSFIGGSIVGNGSPFTTTPDYQSSNYYRYYAACTNGTCTSNGYVQSPNFYFFATPSNVTVSDTAFCGTASEITLTGDCGSGAGGSTIQWYDELTDGSLLGTGSPFNHTPASTTTYYAECVSNNYDCSTLRVASKEVVVGQPVTEPTGLGTSADAVCEGDNVTVSATCSTGIVHWYDQSSNGSKLGTGASFSYVINTATTFYASCEDGGCQSSRIATTEVDVRPSSSGIPQNLTINNNLTGTTTHQAIEYIDASNDIISPANVVYESGKAINLKEGFETQNGIVFTARADLLVCP